MALLSRALVMLTAQNVYDIVVNGLRAQGGPSYRTDPYGPMHTTSYYCQYRAPNGRKCAAGQIIPDDRYREGLEGTAWKSLSTEFPELEPHTDLLSEMQKAHDGPFCGNKRAPGDDEWKSLFEPRAKDVAEYFGLVYTPPTS